MLSKRSQQFEREIGGAYEIVASTPRQIKKQEIQQGITREQAFELATESERPILEILLRDKESPILTNRRALQAAREIARQGEAGEK